MEKIDKLIIKACKTEDTDDHLRRIYNKYWLSDGHHKEIMIYRMSSLLVQLNLYKTDELIKDILQKVVLDEFICRFHGKRYSDGIPDILYNLLINKIRFMEIDKLTGYKNG